ncbi:MAG: hypothetical protein ACXW0F_05205 [Gaiellaceae bacterium]
MGAPSDIRLVDRAKARADQLSPDVVERLGAAFRSWKACPAL